MRILAAASWPALLLLLAGCSSLDPSAPSASWERDAVDASARKAWQEEQVAWPAFPREASLREFHPGPLGGHRFFLDVDSLRLDSDGVARYTVVVQAGGGARSVSFEGIRCATREKRTYAFGRPGNSWAASRNTAWEPIRFRTANEYQAALYADYFCPEGAIARDVGALRRTIATEAGDPRARVRRD